MKLIGSLTSPYVRKVRVVLAEKKLDYAIELEDVWLPETTIHELNPLGKVPCLVLEDGDVMYDSRVIVEYLDTLTPVCKLLPPNGNGRERAAIKNWEALADGVLDAGVAMRLERIQRPPELQSAEQIARQMGKVERGMASMSDRLGDNAWCAGNHYSLADVAVGCALGWFSFRFPDIDWRGAHPNLGKLFDKLSERASFKDTVPQG
ncbi:glutathione S-transferase family protein [Massilia endophytica]|uniref:glutathione S-transferase family protein n=1 Tax=Massilia endophytica TaxID=2899220 RepID=UPI001E5F30D1|nr:glutathione S-transferase N-terminal domain-containing protein [Massilia endophytica]UGQ46000.1 glutathione S-transferase N-terminal domain-containing protein [Massilia endophytica]